MSILRATLRYSHFASRGQLQPGCKSMKIAIIGQSVFGAEVFKKLHLNGHQIVGVFTVPDVDGKPDPLALAAEAEGTQIFKYSRWRNKGVLIPEIFETYKALGPQLNVMPFCSQYIPMDVVNFPEHKSIIYHPSLLPKQRGASAINWTLMKGDTKAGLTVFWADEGLDTGPILLQKECNVEINDTVDSLYTRFLMPAGIEAMVESVNLISSGHAPRITQNEAEASYDPILKKDKVKISWNQSALQLHNFIRGNDKVPGAWGVLDGQTVTFYGSRMWDSDTPSDGTPIVIEGLDNGTAFIHSEGLLIPGNDGKLVNVTQLRFEDTGKMIVASRYGCAEETLSLGTLSESEIVMQSAIKNIWENILGHSISDDTDFFKSGASSMDVTRLVESIKEQMNVVITNDDVFMATQFDTFVGAVIMKSRGVGDHAFEYDAISISANNRTLTFPHQLFINNKFVDSKTGKQYATINPFTEEPICQLSLANAEDVFEAVEAAKKAFEEGEWSKMNARDRGNLMFKLADLMEEHKEELATLESLDSGAVYTLALKTHVGMSIDTFRYFGGWCDKIQGSVIPINSARPNKNLCFTKKEPIGVCGIIVPWNYPLMMLAWKSAACLAAGNTLILKPAQVTPLTALKFCELAVKAGFPPGVINVITGSGAIVGEALSQHPDVRKIGFTGSTPIGKTIMQRCASSNLKKVSLELGGKSPLIIFDDCDLEKAVRQACSSVYFNKGENCIAAGRIFVQDTLHDKFLDLVRVEVSKMKIGDPLDRFTDHGPQNHLAHMNKLIEYCDKGVKEGATLVLGGKRMQRKGLFMEPTIFTNVEDNMFIAQEESFGPVMIISKFSSMKEVLQRANATEFGLASGVFTKDMSKALTVADGLQAGTVFVNTYNKTDVAAPFGGFKQSGFGKDLGSDALHEWLKTKTITVEY